MPLPFTEDTLDEYISRPRDCALKTAREIKGDVLVLGAAGKMGLHLVLMLRHCFEHNKQKNRVIAVSRFSSSGTRSLFERAGIQTVACDLSDPDELTALPDVENIWFVAGVKFSSSANLDLLHKVNVEMPRNVARRFKNARITALSTGCVYSFVPTDSSGSAETDPTASDGEYSASCRGREAAFRNASENEGLRAVLIRLNYSVEMRYGVLVDIAQRVLSCQPIDISMSRFNCIWQGDAIAHIISASSLAESPASTLNVTGPGSHSIRQTAEAFGTLLNKKPVFIGEEQKTTWLNNADKAIGMFGVPEVTPDMLIEWTAEWLKKGGKTLGKPTKFEVRNGEF